MVNMLVILLPKMHSFRMLLSIQFGLIFDSHFTTRLRIKISVALIENKCEDERNSDGS